MKMEIERLLGSRGRVRLLGILSYKGEMNITRLAREANLHHNSALRHLEFLSREGILTEKRFGRVRIYALNTNNQSALAIMRLFRSWPASDKKQAFFC